MKGQEIAQQSKKYITIALLQLMEKHPYEKITIKDITDHAGVARLTFYRNFTNKDDVLKEYLQNMFTHYMEELDNESSLVDALTVCFSYWKSNGHFTELLIKNEIEYILFEPFKEYVRVVLDHYQISYNLTDIQKEFITGGLFFSMIDWIKDNNNSTPRESAKQILSILNMPFLYKS